MPIQFDQQNPLVSAEQISEFESTQGLTLPEDYKQFLLETNGGELKAGMLVDYRHEKVGMTKATVGVFFGIRIPGTSLPAVNLENVNADLKAEGRLPQEFIRIGDTDGGHGIYILSTSEAHFGQIYLGDDHQVDYDSIYIIADSFTEFLAKITPSLPI